MTTTAFILGLVIGACVGVLLMALLIMARDPGPIENPHGNDDGRDQLAQRVRDALNAEEGVKRWP